MQTAMRCTRSIKPFYLFWIIEFDDRENEQKCFPNTTFRENGAFLGR